MADWNSTLPREEDLYLPKFIDSLRSREFDLFKPVTADSLVREFLLSKVGPLEAVLFRAGADSSVLVPGLADNLPDVVATEPLLWLRREPTAAFFSANLFFASSSLAAFLCDNGTLEAAAVAEVLILNLEVVGASSPFLAIFSRTAFYFSRSFFYLSSAVALCNPLEGVFNPEAGVVGSPFLAILSALAYSAS